MWAARVSIFACFLVGVTAQLCVTDHASPESNAATTCAQCLQACADDPFCFHYSWNGSSVTMYTSDICPGHCLVDSANNTAAEAATTCLECYQACQNDAACTTYSWHESVPYAVSLPTFCGLCDFGYVSSSASSATNCVECQEECYIEPECTAYSWNSSAFVNYDVDSCPGPCYLSDSPTTAQVARTCSACQQLCLNSSSCMSYSWNGNPAVSSNTTCGLCITDNMQNASAAQAAQTCTDCYQACLSDPLCNNYSWADSVPYDKTKPPFCGLCEFVPSNNVSHIATSCEACYQKCFVNLSCVAYQWGNGPLTNWTADSCSSISLDPTASPTPAPTGPTSSPTPPVPTAAPTSPPPTETPSCMYDVGPNPNANSCFECQQGCFYDSNCLTYSWMGNPTSYYTINSCPGQCVVTPSNTATSVQSASNCEECRLACAGLGANCTAFSWGGSTSFQINSTMTPCAQCEFVLSIGNYSSPSTTCQTCFQDCYDDPYCDYYGWGGSVVFYTANQCNGVCQVSDTAPNLPAQTATTCAGCQDACLNSSQCTNYTWRGATAPRNQACVRCWLDGTNLTPTEVNAISTCYDCFSTCYNDTMCHSYAWMGGDETSWTANVCGTGQPTSSPPPPTARPPSPSPTNTNTSALSVCLSLNLTLTQVGNGSSLVSDILNCTSPPAQPQDRITVLSVVALDDNHTRVCVRILGGGTPTADAIAACITQPMTPSNSSHPILSQSNSSAAIVEPLQQCSAGTYAVYCYHPPPTNDAKGAMIALILLGVVVVIFIIVSAWLYKQKKKKSMAAMDDLAMHRIDDLDAEGGGEGGGQYTDETIDNEMMDNAKYSRSDD